MGCSEGSLDLSKSIGSGGAGDNSCICKSRKAVESLEEINSLLEIICYLFLSCIAVVAARCEGANAGTMFGPFVLPEGLIVALVVFPLQIVSASYAE